MPVLPQPPLLLITDRGQARQPLPALAAAAFAGGCRWISLREKDLPAEARRDLLRQLWEEAGPYGARVTVHGDLEAARLCHGVHLPGDGNVMAARALLGPQAVIGQSCHTLEDVRLAAISGADYVTLSPIFVSPSKPGYGPALGLEVLAAVQAFGVPVIALGGIDAENTAGCLRAGAAGVAVMGGIMRADDPAAALRRLTAALDERRALRPRRAVRAG